MFRLTIRELLLLTLVVGLGMGWWIDRSRLANAAYRASVASYRLKWVDDQLHQKGYDLRWDDESGTIGFYYIEPPLLQADRPQHPSDGD